MKFYISYLRLSKKKYDADPDYYGLDAQRKTITETIQKNEGTLLKEYCEIESGTRGKRQRRREIVKAIQHCRDSGATLIVAKLDRLARDSEFVLSVVNSGIDVMFCDFKFEGIVGRLMLMILSAFAEYEASRISQRTKEGLAIARAKGVKLGNPNLDHKTAAAASVKARRENMHTTANVMIKGRIELMVYRDGMSYPDVCKKLNSEGLRTTRKRKFTPSIICRILKPPKNEQNNSDQCSEGAAGAA